MSAEKQDSRLDTLDIEIQCPVKTRVLGVMRAFVSSVAGQMGFDDEACDQIEMAVDEACANVVRHAYKHLGVSPDLPDCDRKDELLADCDFRMRVAFSEEVLEITITDHGIGVDKTPPGASSVAEYESRGGHGGLGVFIIRNFMDEASFESQPEGGTKLVMRKFLRPENASTE
ncbi:ATP-binding protein [Candidatus Sumerlaeota bacterium]|nr:ATP-binding protein [Candidatus Sumerlaeota bacterium]